MRHKFRHDAVILMIIKLMQCFINAFVCIQPADARMCLTVPDEVALEIWDWPGLEDSLVILGTRICSTQYSQRSVHVELSTTQIPIPF